MAAFDASSLVASINSIPYGAYATSDTTGLVFYFNPPLSTRVDITTCFNATTVATVVSLLDGETLLPIRCRPGLHAWLGGVWGSAAASQSIAPTSRPLR